MRPTRSAIRTQTDAPRLPRRPGRSVAGRSVAGPRLGVLAVGWLLAFALPRVTIAQEAAPRLQEVVVTVAELEPLQAAFTEVLRWKVIFRGDLRRGEATGWGLPPDSRGRQLLMGSAGADYGHIRFIELAAPHAGPMRPAPRWWDRGGAFAINLFVSDAAAVLEGLRARSWTTSLPLQSYEERAGGQVVARGRFARMIGPHDLVLSFQERQVPPLDKWPRFTGASHVENVMEPIASLDAWTRVTASLLGVAAPAPTVRDVSARPEAAATYGLPPSLATQAGARQSILRIGRSKEQMLTAWQFDSLRGEDYASQVDARHLGVLALRVRIPDVDEAARRMQAVGADFVENGEDRRMRPYGAIRSVVIRSGGGSGLLLEALQFEAASIR